MSALTPFSDQIGGIGLYSMLDGAVVKRSGNGFVSVDFEGAWLTTGTATIADGNPRRKFETTGTATITVPAAAAGTGRTYILLNGAGTMTVDVGGGGTIDGASSVVTSVVGTIVIISSNGTEYKNLVKGAVQSVNAQTGVVTITHAGLAGSPSNNHAAIDAFIASKGAASGLATLDGGGKVPLSELAQGANALLILDGGGKVPVAALPDTALITQSVVADLAARIALLAATVQPGDVVFQTDEQVSYILTDPDPSIDGNWAKLSTTRNTFEVADQAARLLLSTADLGDEAVQADIPATFRLKGADPSQNSNWVQLPGGAAGGSSFPPPETITSEVVTGTDTALADQLDNAPTAAAESQLVWQGLVMTYGVGKDYTIAGQVITWLAATGTAPDLVAADDISIRYDS